MASVRKRDDKWQAQVRRTGHAPRSKAFISRADALRWIRQTEQELDRTGLTYGPLQLEAHDGSRPSTPLWSWSWT